MQRPAPVSHATLAMETRRCARTPTDKTATTPRQDNPAGHCRRWLLAVTSLSVGAKKSSRKAEETQGGKDSVPFPGAIGRCVGVRRTACSFEADDGLHAERALRGPQDPKIPDADSSRALMHVLIFPASRFKTSVRLQNRRGFGTVCIRNSRSWKARFSTRPCHRFAFSISHPHG